MPTVYVWVGEWETNGRLTGTGCGGVVAVALNETREACEHMRISHIWRHQFDVIFVSCRTNDNKKLGQRLAFQPASQPDGLASASHSVSHPITTRLL